MELACYSKYILIKNLLIPKMFDGVKHPKILKEKRYEDKIKNYILNNPDKTYDIQVKDINSETDCVAILQKTVDKISEETTGKKYFSFGNCTNFKNLSYNLLYDKSFICMFREYLQIPHGTICF